MTNWQLTNLMCDYLSAPMGVSPVRPRFSWILEGSPAPDCVYARIVLYDAQDIPVWDSGERYALDGALAYDGVALHYASFYRWELSVRPMTSRESALLTAESHFETCLCPSCFRGRWIAADSSEEAPVFRRRFRLDNAPRRARIYLSGLGFHELYVNGCRVEDTLYNTLWTAYHPQPETNMLYPYHYEGAFRVPYRACRCDGLFAPGLNTIEVRLGNGWYHQNQRLTEGDLWYGDRPCLLLEAWLDDLVIVSDENFTWSAGRITRNNIFLGEDQDLRRTGEPERPVRTVSGPCGLLSAQLCPLDRMAERYDPAAAFRDAGLPGGVIVDFGQNLSGFVEMNGHGRRGDRLTLTFAETIDPAGDGARMNYASCGGDNQIQRDSFILAGAEKEMLRPSFCWHGYRYAALSLEREGKTVPLRLEEGKIIGEGCRFDVQSVFVTSSGAQTSCLETSDDRLNWLHRVSMQALRSNLHCGVPSDCPHRERLGYTGDGQLTVETALLNFDLAPFYIKWMQDIFDAQNRRTGHVPHTAPFYNGGGGPGGWGGAVLIVPWTIYRHTGDRRVLQTAWPFMVHFMDYLADRCDEYIVIREEDGGWCLGDWCAPEKLDLPAELVNTWFYLYLADRMAEAAAVLGYDKVQWVNLAASIRRAFKRTFYDEESGVFSTGCQGADVYALTSGALTAQEDERVFSHLLNSLDARGNHLDTGIFATPLLFELLMSRGEADRAVALLTAPDAPSYLALRGMGATTLYENWSGGSHNHHMFASIDVWLHKYAGGLSQAKESVGWATAELRPGALPGLKEGGDQLATPRGRLSIRWRREGETLTASFHIPATMCARLVAPKGFDSPGRLFGGGDHVLTLHENAAECRSGS